MIQCNCLGCRNCQTTEAKGFARGPQVTNVTHSNKSGCWKRCYAGVPGRCFSIRNRENLKIEASRLFRVPKELEENVLAKDLILFLYNEHSSSFDLVLFLTSSSPVCLSVNFTII